MKTIRCDKCGKIFEENKPIRDYTYTIKNDRKDVDVDLCDECREKFLIWLGVKNPQNIYDEYFGD